MATMAPALTDPAPDAHHLRFKLAPPSSTLPAGETNGSSPTIGPAALLPLPDDLGKLQPLASSYPGKEPLKLAGVFAQRSILSQSLLNGADLRRGRTSVLEFHLEELRGIGSCGGGHQLGAPLNGLAKKPTKAAEKPQLRAAPAVAPLPQTASPAPRPPPAAGDGQKGTPAKSDSQARLLALLRRHGEMELRARRLQKRLRVAQAKQVDRHLQQQLGGLLGVAAPAPDAPPRLTMTTRKAEASLRRGGSGAAGADVFLRGAGVAQELERLSWSGAAALRVCEGGFDSDVTESSSGGESDAEEEELSRAETEQRHTPLKQRCAWSWAQDRAAIVSRWNWLQAHVSDLEYRIRQQTDFYKQLRTGKGLVVLGEACPPDPSTADPLRPAPQATRREKPASPTPAPRTAAEAAPGVRLEGPPVPPTDQHGDPKACASQRPVNGVINMLPIGLSPRESSEPEGLTLKKPRVSSLPPPPDASSVCARTRPLVLCKKRRLVRPAGLLSLSKERNASPGGCHVSPCCSLCAGLPSPASPFPFAASTSERLSLLDLGMHPVLSFPDDVPVGLRFLSLLRSQNKPPDKPSKRPTLRQRAPDITRTTHTHRLSLHRPPPALAHRPLSPRPERPAPLPTSCTKRRQPGAPDRAAVRHFVDMRVPSPMSASARHTTHSPLTRQLSVPSEGATPYHTNSATARRRRTESASFDINNIVIPMSVAASTRPERLQYKEILTPSWRVVHITPLSGCEEAPEELEDLSDAAFCALHTACEETERLRWVSSPSAALQRRGSRSHRSSDGCITPQPPGGAPHLTPQPPSPDSWYPLPDFLFPPSPLSPDTLSAPPTPASRDDPWLPSEETRSTVSESEPEPAVVQPWERRYFPLPYNPKTEGDGPWDPRDRGGPRPPRRASCSSKTAKEADGPPSSPAGPRPPSKPRPLHR